MKNLNKLLSLFKKNYLYLVILLSMSAATQAQLPSITHLKLYLNFSSGSVSDLSPVGNTASYVGPGITTCPDRFGNPSCALSFTATDYIEFHPITTDFDITAGEDFSVSVWYKGGSALPGDLEYLFDKVDNNIALAPLQSDYHLGLYDLNHVVLGKEYSPYVLAPIVPAAGLWHNVIGMYDHTSTTWDLYIDGALAGSTTGITFNSSPSDPIRIGGGWEIVTNAYKNFVGCIDDIRFYDCTLTPGEIASIYADANSCTGCGCPSPTGLFFNSCIPSNTSNLQWTGNACAFKYQVQIRDMSLTPPGPWVTQPLVSATNILIPTIPAHTYRWRVRSKCITAAGTATWSLYSSINVFVAQACRLGDEDDTQGMSLINVYPNPASTEITIDAIEPQSIISIVDMLGKTVINQEASASSITFSIEQLPAGVYFVNIQNGQTRETKKFTKIN